MQGMALAVMAVGNALISLPLTALLLAHQPAADATIRGRVFDADGRPMSGVQMTAVVLGTDPDRPASAPSLSTLDGRFELTPVATTKILLRAQPPVTEVDGQATSARHPPAYFPGVLDRRDAWPIDVTPGEIIELDFHVPPVFIGSIKTIVSGPEGYTLEYLRVMRPESNQVKNVRVSEAGVGHADDLRAGRYVIAARARLRDSLLVASQIVQMTGGEIPVPLMLVPAARVHGRVVVLGNGVRASDLRVTATWTDRTIDLDPLARDDADVARDGGFSIDGLFGLRKFAVVGLPDGWQVAAIWSREADLRSGIELQPGSTTELSIVVAPQSQGPLGFRQPLPLERGTAALRGQVLDVATGKPVEGADVRLVNSTPEREEHAIPGRTVVIRAFMRGAKTVTNADGTFAFDDIKHGTHRLSVSHPWYFSGCGTHPLCEELVLEPDQKIADIKIGLQRGGIIRGRLRDPEGQPIAIARVIAEHEDRAGGNAGVATSDADGRFEVGSLPAGRFLVRVEPRMGLREWRLTTYYPGVPDRDAAQVVTVETGAATEIEIREREVPVATIRTALSGPEGFRVDKMWLAQPDTKMLVAMKVADDGTASVTDLGEARYAIAARATAAATSLAAYQLISIGVGDYDVPMRLEPTAAITGRIVVDRGGVPPVDGVNVEAHWVDGDLRLDPMGPDRATASPDGAFTMRGLFGRRIFTLAGMPEEWRVVAVLAGRSDITSGVVLAPGSMTEITIVIAQR